MSAPETSSSRKPLLIALAAVVVLALLVWFVVMPLLLGDDANSGDIAAAPVPTETATGGADGAVEPAPSEGEVVEGEVQSTFDVFTARDPFEQLVVAAAASPTEQVTATDGTVTPAPTATPTASPTPSSDTSVEGTRVEMLDTYTSAAGITGANVTVNGSGYNVEEGQSFAGGFTLLDVTDGCGTFTHDGSRFVLCIGDTIRK